MFWFCPVKQMVLLITTVGMLSGMTCNGQNTVGMLSGMTCNGQNTVGFYVHVWYDL